MESFLSKVITDVLYQKKVSVQNLVFILPSQRACVFLKEELIKQLHSASFLPQINSIETFIQEVSALKQLDTIQLLFEFYSIYKKHTLKKELDSFDTFSQWATVVLQDFNEVDRHLIDSKDLFIYLRDINRLKNWTPTTEITKNYFSFFEKLHLYYDEFYNYLISNKIGYQGLLYRKAQKRIQDYINENKEKHFVLVGFNALNKSEEYIFQELLNSGLGSIYWDVDKSYMNPSKETGVFLRKYKEEWNYYDKHPFCWIENHFQLSDKNIQVIGATRDVSQVKYAGELLQNNTNYENTALVLADESLLSLTLNSLPNTIDKINITMGFPLNQIPLSDFFNSIFKLYLNQEKLDMQGKNLFYYKDLINLTNSPYFTKLIRKNSNTSTQIGKSNRIFLSQQNIVELFTNIDSDAISKVVFLFEKGGATVQKTLQNCIDICKQLQSISSGIEREYVYRFFTIFQQLETLNEKYGHITDLKTLYKFFTQFAKNEKLSFQGEPLQGLQLMGMLETRVIDFETVIITSVNEGVLPSSKSDNSFIPFDVKKHFGLPTYQEKDAIFSYHFFRLLQRAKNIYLLYNTEEDAYGSGEKSRFLAQLENERDDIKHKFVSQKAQIEIPALQEITKKSPKLMEKMKELAIKGISPSALATYIYNPIDFYYQKILKIREVEEVEETVAANTMGTVIHDTLEQLYKPFIGVFLTENSLKKMFSKVDDLVTEIFQKEYKNGDITKGKNKLIFEVSKKYVNRFLKQELQEIKEGKQLKIIALEQELSAQIDVENLDFPIKIHGKVDRIDQVDGVLRIIDYKTGLVQQNQLKMTDFSVMSEDYKYTKALQVMLYAYLYSQENNIDFTQPIEAGIISFKNLKNGFLKMNFAEGRGKSDHTITEEKMNEFLAELKRILVEIFNPKIPFKENPDKAF